MGNVLMYPVILLIALLMISDWCEFADVTHIILGMPLALSTAAKAVLWTCREVDASVSSELVGAGEAFIASWMCTSVGLLACVRTDVPSLRGVRSKPLVFSGASSPGARGGRKLDHKEDIYTVSGSCSCPC